MWSQGRGALQHLEFDYYLVTIYVSVKQTVRRLLPAAPRYAALWFTEMPFGILPAGQNYCAVNNGGCTHLCLATPVGRSCRCPNNAVGCVEDGGEYWEGELTLFGWLKIKLRATQQYSSVAAENATENLRWTYCAFMLIAIVTLPFIKNEITSAFESCK